MEISVIIPTIGREKDIAILFESITLQNQMPLEIIVVDQSDSSETKELCKKWSKTLPIRYFYFEIKSLTKARNYGLTKSQGDIIAFLDDDTRLEPDYFYQINNFFQLYPQALGGMGKILNQEQILDRFTKNEAIKKIAQFMGFLFVMHSYQKRFKVLKSGHHFIPERTDQTSVAEWLSGCAWYKKEIFKEFQFEEKFIKWSFGEDLLFSYQVHLKYPGSLFYFPEAKLYHFESQTNRLNGKEKITMKTIYQYWFFYKCINRGYIFYWWRAFGEIIFYTVSVLFGKESVRNLYLYFKAYCLLIKNNQSIKKGELNKYLI